MANLTPMKELPQTANWNKDDTCVIFGEVFQRGYVNGLIDEALKRNMNVIYSTVGRRDADGNLRSLNAEELQEKDQPLINLPLEAGFDMASDSENTTPCQQLQGIKMKEWASTQLNWELISESRKKGMKDFILRTQKWVQDLRKEGITEPFEDWSVEFIIERLKDKR